ncbi:prolyl aminopeptidase [Thalassotalea fusca]
MSHQLYPKIAENSHQLLSVDNGRHQLYVEESGNVNGIPVIYIHGGPGGGTSENHRRYFDPELYHIILFDQRGCGRSQPSPSIDANNTSLLIEDIEAIRLHFGVDKWLVTGGSWGTTLAMCYGIAHPERCLGFILRGVFLGEQNELEWLYGLNGAGKFFPDYYQIFTEDVCHESSRDVIEHYFNRLTDHNEVAAVAASKNWYLWELRLSSLEHNFYQNEVEDPHQAHCMALLSCYYFKNNCFIEENFLRNNINKIGHIPSIIIHGRYDMVCQINQAYELAELWDNASLQILPQAGHSGFESQTIDAFCKATDIMASFLKK